MNGIVSGGWEFVWAAYIISSMVIFGYATRTFMSVRTGIRRSRPAEAGPHTRGGR